MTLQRRLLFCVFFICFHFLRTTAQNATAPASLSEVFLKIEKQFNCNFSYQDIAISTHRVELNIAENLETTLARLSQKTLFNYTLLQDNTIAVRQRENLVYVCGIVKNGQTDLPLQNVLIQTPYQQLGTDNTGSFKVYFLSPTQTFSIQYAGFETRESTAESFSQPPCKTVNLSPKIEELQQVFLTNYLAKGISKNRNGSLGINYNNFDILPGLIEPDVLQTLQALPGIQSVDETVSFINIRGGTNDQNLILLDGVKMYQSGHFFGLISAFNPFLTEEVTLIKNGASSSYGDGVSGIIEMQGASTINKKATAGIGTNLISSDAYVDLPLGEKASIQLAGRALINGLLETPTFEAYFEKVFQETEVNNNSETQSVSDDAFNFFDAYARLLYRPSNKDYIRLNFLALDNELEFLENAQVGNELISRGSNLAQRNLSAGIFYRREWNERWLSDIQLYGTSYRLQSNNVDVISNQELAQQNKLLESGVKLRVNHRINGQFESLFGYQFNETGITNFEQINNPFFERTDKQVIRTHSVFGDFTYQSLNQKTTLTLGLRVNHIGKFNKILWEPRLSFQHQLAKYLTFEVLGELKSQTTSQIIDFQNDFLGVENRRWVLSNPESLPIIKGQQISTGFTYIRKGWQISLEPYLKHIDGISAQSQGFQNQFQNRKEHGSYFVKGMDFLLNKRFKKLNTWLSYSYAENDYTFPEFVPQEFANNIDIRHTLTYGINYNWNSFNVAAGLNWHSGKPTTTPVVGNEIENDSINFNLPNTSNIDDYFRLDVSATYDFAIGKKVTAFAGLSIWNLLDTSNVVNNFYRTNINGELEEINERALSFTPNATFRLQF